MHPLPTIDYSGEIPNPMDRKRMGATQLLGVYAAGQALATAGLRDRTDILANSAVIVGIANGEHDIAFDESLFSEPQKYLDGAALNQALTTSRPSLLSVAAP